MSFNSIPKIEHKDFYIDYAFRTMRKEVSLKKVRGDKFNKQKTLELEKLKSFNKVLNFKLKEIIVSFPNFDNLSEFYEELVRILLDFDKIKGALGALNWAKEIIVELTKEYSFKIKRASTIEVVKNYTSQYFGRIASVFKQISDSLDLLENTRLIMRDFPSIKEGLFTVAIAGFPNVGKSTLLSKLTTSKPEIKPYAFTTKKLNVGYMDKGVRKIQFIDTPGTLNRMEKMNEIEKMAYLAVKYCADMVVYIYDLTETYSLDDQKKLFKRLKLFDKPLFIYLSKTDVLDDKLVKKFLKKNRESIINIDELKDKIFKNSP